MPYLRGTGLALMLATFACGGGEHAPPPPVATDILNTRTVGLAYLEENRLDEAEAEFLKLIALVPDEALGHANLGLVYLRQGRYDQAEEHLERALVIDPIDADVRLILATVYEQVGRRNDAIAELQRNLETDPSHARSLYTIATLQSPTDEAGTAAATDYLSRLVERLPGNIAAHLMLLEAWVRRGDVEPATIELEGIGRLIPELPREAVRFHDEALARLRASDVDAARPSVRAFHNLLKATLAYQAAIADLQGPGGADIGFPVLTFSEGFAAVATDARAVFEALRFTDVTDAAGLNIFAGADTAGATPDDASATLSLGDYDADGDQDLLVASAARTVAPVLLRNELGRFLPTAFGATGSITASVFGDYDNDGQLDLYVVRDGSNGLFRNLGDGTFEEVTNEAQVGDAATGRGALFADLDHDGDLDLFVADATVNRLYRNNLDGTFTERAAPTGLGDRGLDTRDAAIGDFDEDGDLDLFIVNANATNALFSNMRGGRFGNVTDRSGMGPDGGGGGVAAGDYDNDGFLDLFVTGRGDTPSRLYRNRGDGTFERDNRSPGMFEALSGFVALDAVFADVDNDGFLDLVVAGRADRDHTRGLLLFHNDGGGRYRNESSRVPESFPSAGTVAVADYNDDGDLDLFIGGLDGRVRLLRNDGGNANRYLKLQLVGLSAGNGKNNHFGIGSKVEVRAGDLYQTRVVTDPVTHFGLGQHLKADVVRIVWTNGVPQNFFFPGSDQDLVEQQTLKGSCAFLYVWDGEDYTFVTDMMWRSAIGMPMGIMAHGTAYAPPDASREYLKIPTGLLASKDGVFSIQITEELWEAAYIDEVKLIAVDHPDASEVYVDERFVPPSIATPLRTYQVAEKHAPRAAFDERHNDLLPLIEQPDDVYVANLRPARYQGLVEMHDLTLDLGDAAHRDSVMLFLKGWIFPTDASINVAIAQSRALEVVPPYVQVVDEHGRWQTVIENMSFPAGKSKMVVVDLGDKFLSNDRRVRIRTNMEIYWDYIFFSVGSHETATRFTALSPVAADVHYRGFSRLFRKGGRFGPHWFDYTDVSTEPKWRDLEGRYTRYGDVLPLLTAPEDMYAIINAGDEVTVQFDAHALPALEPGWRRDFLIYSDGWIKDGDLNTATGGTVQPLPFHGMSRYPYGPEEMYPPSDGHRDYLRTYNTRQVGRERF